MKKVIKWLKTVYLFPFMIIMGIEGDAAEPTGDGESSDNSDETADTESAEEEVTEESEETTEDTSAAPKKENKVQKRIDELTREKYEAQRERDYYKGLADGRGKPEEPAQQDPIIPGLPAKPQVESFDTYEDFVEALTDWKVDVKEARKTAQTQQEQAQQHIQTATAKHQERVQTAITSTYPDYVETVNEIIRLPFAVQTADAVIESEFSVDIAYYLGKNKTEASRIAQLPVTKQLVEIGKIEARFEKKEPPTKRITQAPVPITPVGGKSNAEPNPDNMTDEEWIKFENARVRKLGRIY